MKRSCLALFLLIAASAQAQPRIQNGVLETHPVQGSLEQTFRKIAQAESGPSWIGYAVPSIRRESSTCCGTDSCCGACRLEGSSANPEGAKQDGVVRLESSNQMLVMFRVEGGRINRIRTFPANCQLDAGRLRIHWLGDVPPTDSIKLLAGFTSPADADSGSLKLGQSALTAIALHEDGRADEWLRKFAESQAPSKLRQNAIFWLGSARGKKGFEALAQLVKREQDPSIREHIAFALFTSKEPQSTTALISIARTDSSPRVRSKALFWLAQRAGRQAAGTIAEAVEKDPEMEVKRQAVFALSRLPKDEGIPLLIQVARTAPNPAVRRQAMFWLGQSKDDRALRFFEEILTR
ncbi:MAG: HEAT repeat domain-containing protein [Bryobacteraceae bacterium]|nr:HEAT repeat domain-containing protein [Bryobacteraceae bacterium]